MWIFIVVGFIWFGLTILFQPRKKESDGIYYVEVSISDGEYDFPVDSLMVLASGDSDAIVHAKGFCEFFLENPSSYGFRTFRLPGYVSFSLFHFSKFMESEDSDLDCKELSVDSWIDALGDHDFLGGVFASQGESIESTVQWVSFCENIVPLIPWRREVHC